MRETLRVSVGQWSDRGRKDVQQDFHGACVPPASSSLLHAKGVAVALADGISSSPISHEASRHAVGSFLADYYCTPDAWSVKTSVERVVTATNAWLLAQTRRRADGYDQDRGCVCTFTALVLKGRGAHVFHVGDARVQRVAGRDLEVLTTDHRVYLGGGQSYLARALGVGPLVDIDYRTMIVAVGDVFVLTTDGVHEHVDGRSVVDAIARSGGDLDAAAHAIVDEALTRGSDDNLTVQIVRVDALPPQRADELARSLDARPLPPWLEPRMTIDGYTIVRELHASARSSLHLARDEETGTLVAIKTPSTDLREDPAGLERFLLEEWVARRIANPHVLALHAPERPRGYLYVATEFIDGRTLAQWMRDHPRPTMEAVRSIVDQIAQGLRAFHRQEMLHQDVRPENVMIDAAGVAKIIDFGAVRVAGLVEAGEPEDGDAILGTEQFTAPEYFAGEAGTWRSDQYSLGVVAYQMLSGRLPYGADVSRIRSPASQAKLRYRSVLDVDREIPAWIDAALRRAVHPNPLKRYEALSEFVHDLRHPPHDAGTFRRTPLIDRNPLLFWKGVSLVLLVAVLVLLRLLIGRSG